MCAAQFFVLVLVSTASLDFHHSDFVVCVCGRGRVFSNATVKYKVKHSDSAVALNSFAIFSCCQILYIGRPVAYPKMVYSLRTRSLTGTRLRVLHNLCGLSAASSFFLPGTAGWS